MGEFLFVEPERDIAWTLENREEEYQRQYKKWKEREEYEKRENIARNQQI